MPTATTPLTEQELAAWRGLLEAHALLTRQLDAQMHAEHGLSLSSYEVLMFLDDAPEHRMRMSEIADRALLSRSGCTRLVDRLVHQGYVTRCAASTDGRGLYAQLTDAGLEKIRAARATHHEGIRRYFLERLTPTDRVALGDIWTRLRAGGA
jgi:DNA-binding MarR family transcriptional regulator